MGERWSGERELEMPGARENGENLTRGLTSTRERNRIVRTNVRTNICNGPRRGRDTYAPAGALVEADPPMKTAVSPLNPRESFASHSGPARNTEQYRRKLEHIVHQAAVVFREHGYHQATIRDIARATGVSLAGLYYYFSSKEQLLYLIQFHTFQTILNLSRAQLQPIRHPEERLATFVRLHMLFLLDHPHEMWVINHEDSALRPHLRKEVNAAKKAYYRLCAEQVEAIKHARRLDGLNVRVATLALFGMMNWVHTWYNPKVDPAAGDLAGLMLKLFYDGLFDGRNGRAQGKKRASRTASPLPITSEARLFADGAASVLSIKDALV